MALEYIRLESHQLRLIKVLETSPRTRINLTTHDRESAPRYTALSYAWGDHRHTTDLECNGRRTVITIHLAQALQDIHDVWPDELLWIDAISINQHDAREKETQVYNMDLIYRLAQRVLVYLGPAQDGSDLAMAGLDRIKDYQKDWDLTSDESKMHWLANSKQYTHDLFDASMYQPLMHLSERAWFKRAWVVQEYVCAKTVVMQCGTRYLPAMAFRHGCKLLSVFSFGGSAPREYSSGDVIFEGFHQFLAMHEVRRQRLNGEDIDFFDTVMAARHRNASQRVDKLYAVLSLATGQHISYKDNVPLNYCADSTVAYWHPYRDFAKHALIHEPNLRLFHYLDSCSTPPCMPSWCPDLTHFTGLFPLEKLRRMSNVEWYASGLQHAQRLSPSDPSTMSDANGQSTKQVSSHVQVCISGDLLSLKGIMFDEIVATGPRCEWDIDFNANNAVLLADFIRHFSSWLSESRDFLESRGVLAEASSAVLFFMSFVDEQSSSDDTPDRADLFETFAQGLKILDGHLEQSSAAVRTGEQPFKAVLHASRRHDEGRITPEDFLQSHIKWMQQMNRCWFHRALFATRGGMLGLATQHVQSGDKVCVLYGGLCPYVLRPYSDGSSHYRFIGDAFVRGAMKGQVLDLLAQGKVVEEEICIR